MACDERAGVARVPWTRRPPLSHVRWLTFLIGFCALSGSFTGGARVAAQTPENPGSAAEDARSGREGQGSTPSGAHSQHTFSAESHTPSDGVAGMAEAEVLVTDEDGVLERRDEPSDEVGPIYDGPIEGIAALVGAEVPGPTVTMILHSDVDLRARLALLRGRPTNLPLQPLPIGVLSAALEELIGEALLLREAERVRLGEPGRAEVRAERGRIVEASGGEAKIITLLRALQAGPEALDRMAERRATVVRFMQASLEGSASVTDAQVARVFEGGAHPFVGHELEDIREPLRSWISQSMLQRAVRRWIRALASRTPVKRVAGYAKAS